MNREGKYFIRPPKKPEDFKSYGEYVDYVLKNLIQLPYKITKGINNGSR